MPYIVYIVYFLAFLAFAGAFAAYLEVFKKKELDSEDWVGITCLGLIWPLVLIWFTFRYSITLPYKMFRSLMLNARDRKK